MHKETYPYRRKTSFPSLKNFYISNRDPRELVSNAVDAFTKVKTIARAGGVKRELGDTRIK
ncbi:MAG: hypothetical protein R2766_00040 [Saprospiraceae bacterium]